MAAREKPRGRRVALVTGGAGGIGSAVCTRLAEDGFQVVVGYRSSHQAAGELVARLPGGGHCALAVRVDDSASLQECAAEIASTYGRLDVLVNNAGITRFVPHADLDALDDDLIDSILRTNVRGVIAGARAFVPLLQANGQGLIVNISSIAAVTAMGSNIAYCASKAAVDNITRSLARALAPAVRVVSVSPGLVDTEFVNGLDPAWRNAQAQATPLRRLASPAEVAHAVLAAASHLTFTTGAVIAVDGGRPLA